MLSFKVDNSSFPQLLDLWGFDCPRKYRRKGPSQRRAKFRLKEPAAKSEGAHSQIKTVTILQGNRCQWLHIALEKQASVLDRQIRSQIPLVWKYDASNDSLSKSHFRLQHQGATRIRMSLMFHHVLSMSVVNKFLSRLIRGPVSTPCFRNALLCDETSTEEAKTLSTSIRKCSSGLAYESAGLSSRDMTESTRDEEKVEQGQLR